jgi:heme-degrading monooxygenase HmoA
MHDDRNGQTAVIFVSQRTDVDDGGYAAAAEAMDRLAAAQPGYRGIDSARGKDGIGVTVSYWADDESAVAWRRHAEHAAIREMGRALWYERYTVSVATVTRGYHWAK